MTDKTLYLMRHAAASAASPAGDAERPLTPDGAAHVARLAARLVADGCRWDTVLCSTAVRARATLEGLMGVAPEAEVLVDERLYLTTPELQLACLREVTESAGSVLVVGHNPALRSLALALALPGGAHYQRLNRDLPAGGFLSLAVDAATWSGLGPKGAYLTGFLAPADVMGD